MPDGRPYFAMKRIRGHDLAKILRVHRQGKAKADDPEPRDLPAPLAIFEQVCQALAYADCGR